MRLALLLSLCSDEESSAQDGQVTCLRLHSTSVAELGLEPRKSGSQVHFLSTSLCCFSNRHSKVFVVSPCRLFLSYLPLMQVHPPLSSLNVLSCAMGSDNPSWQDLMGIARDSL